MLFRSAGQGAPIEWIPFEPAMAVLSTIAVTSNSPKPNAARLFVDFLMSEDGQKLLRDSDYIPVDPAVPARSPGLKPETRSFTAIYVTPEKLVDELPRWTAIYKELFK